MLVKLSISPPPSLNSSSEALLLTSVAVALVSVYPVTAVHPTIPESVSVFLHFFLPSPPLSLQ